MANPQEISALTKAFTGLGVDEQTLISILTKWNPLQIQSYRKDSPEFFKEDERQFQRCNEQHILKLRQDFIRFKDSVVLRIMHPWERDARLFKEALFKEPQQMNVIIEVSCTRSPQELVGARKAYHSLFEHSVEEDVASRLHGIERKLLVALVSAYRYEGPYVNEETAKSEAKMFADAMKGTGTGAGGKKDLIKDEKLIMILATRSKSHLMAMYKYYTQISGNHLDENIEGDWILKQTVQCLCTPQTYFSEVLHASLKANVDESAKDSVTRIILTRADVDIKFIKDEYQTKFGVPLTQHIEEVANGNYKNLLLGLITKDDRIEIENVL